MRKHSVNTTKSRVCGVSDCTLLALVCPLSWSVVLIGAFLTITVTYLLKMQRIVHFVLTAFFAMFIGLVVFVIISLDQPLSGPLAIDSGPYQLVLDRLIDLK
jgi:hypothetical protein